MFFKMFFPKAKKPEKKQTGHTQEKMSKVIIFDLDGVLSPQDHAFEVMKLLPDGDKIFAVISRYDDILTQEVKDHQPGQTLKFIVPILISGKIREREIRERDLQEISARAELVDGTLELIENLRQEGWKIYINSTCYQQHALNSARRLRILRKNTFSTKLPLDKWRKRLRGEDFSAVKRAIGVMVRYHFSEDLASGKKDDWIRKDLDDFFRDLLPPKMKQIMEEVKVTRKAEVLAEIQEREKVEFSEMVVVDDSITGSKMMKAVKEAGGLSIAFNANQYALSQANCALASTNLSDLKYLLRPWLRRKLKGVREAILARKPGKDEPYYHWIGWKTNLKEIEEIHNKFRQKFGGKERARLG